MTTKKEILRQIHEHCLRCMSGSSQEVDNCTAGPNNEPYTECLLWKFRNGLDPEPNASKVEQGRKLGAKNSK